MKKNNTPGSGFSLKKEAAGGNDAYENYQQSAVDSNEVWDMLMTESGRQTIAAQMAVPIRTELDYIGVSRKFFEIDVLAQGQIARYDKDITTPAFVVAKRARVNQYDVEAEYVEPTTWEIFAPAHIRLSQIQQRRFNILDRTQEKIRIAVQLQEDDQFLQLLNAKFAKVARSPLIVRVSFGSDLYLD